MASTQGYIIKFGRKVLTRQGKVLIKNQVKVAMKDNNNKRINYLLLWHMILIRLKESWSCFFLRKIEVKISTQN